MSIGVTVVICCYNSSLRLPTTLAHLACQQVSGEIPWEVVVVDNASTDDTSEVALRAWTELARPAPLRVVRESELGLSYARRRGFTEAAYEYVSFVDDDNWVAPQWIRVVFEVMSEHTAIGACGGINKAVCEAKAPAWFGEFRSSYAIGAQGQEAGIVPQERGFLWGAGLTVRRSVWQELVNSGFHSLLPDRKGNSPTSGGDAELCLAIRLAGWRLWYEPRLCLCHYLPAHRLEWSYLRRLWRGVGVSSIALDPYRACLQPGAKPRSPAWAWQVLGTTWMLLKQRTSWPASVVFDRAGDPSVRAMEVTVGRISELLRKRSDYDRSFALVRGLKMRLSEEHTRHTEGGRSVCAVPR